MNYDPNTAPDPKQWLSLSEDQRQALVQEAHERDPLEKRRGTMHATLQAAVETEIITDPTFHAGYQFLLTQVGSRHEALDHLSDALFDQVTGMMVQDARDGIAALSDADAGRVGRAHKTTAKKPATAAKKRTTRTPKAPPEGTVYQLRVYLEDLQEPFIWRRFLVPASITLGELHRVLQTVMGWQNCHLHAFRKDGVVWDEEGVSEPGYESRNENETRLGDVLTRVRSRLEYTYDFGDEWRHQVVFEKRLPASSEVPVPTCLEGQGACPPEDCGGVWGYSDMLSILEDPEHRDHDSVVGWFPEFFDPLDFYPDAVNELLAARCNRK